MEPNPAPPVKLDTELCAAVLRVLDDEGVILAPISNRVSILLACRKVPSEHRSNQLTLWSCAWSRTTDSGLRHRCRSRSWSSNQLFNSSSDRSRLSRNFRRVLRDRRGLCRVATADRVGASCSIRYWEWAIQLVWICLYGPTRSEDICHSCGRRPVDDSRSVVAFYIARRGIIWWVVFNVCGSGRIGGENWEWTVIGRKNKACRYVCAGVDLRNDEGCQLQGDKDERGKHCRPSLIGSRKATTAFQCSYLKIWTLLNFAADKQCFLVLAGTSHCIWIFLCSGSTHLLAWNAYCLGRRVQRGEAELVK